MSSGGWGAVSGVLHLGSGASPSLLFNNLSVENGVVVFAHKNSVILFPESGVRDMEVKLTKISLKDGAAIMQVKWCQAPGDAHFIVVASMQGLQVWDSTGRSMLLYHSAPVGVFCRGIAASADVGKIFVGTSAGGIIVVNSRSSPMSVGDRFAAHESAVSSLEASGGVLVSGSDSGEVAVWDTASLSKLHTLRGAGHPCSSLALKPGYFVAGFTNGHVTVADASSGVVVADISAHARAVTAVDAHPCEDTFATVGEDAILNVWQVPDHSAGSASVTLLSSVPLDDQVLTGVQFCKGTRGFPLIATSYDNNVIPVIQP